VSNGVFWVVTPCGSCKNRRFGGTWRLLHQGEKIGELGTTLAATSNRRTLRRNTGVTTQKTPFFIVTAVKTSNLTSNVSPVRYEMGFYIPEDGILHSDGRKSLKSYM
jgi:hypothetical protein